MGQKLIPHLVLVPQKLQVAHIGLEGGLHKDTLSQQKAEKMKQLRNLRPFHDKPLQLYKFQHDIKPHDKGFGGWGHPADRKHCLDLFRL